MVSRLQAKAVVLTESCGVTLEAGEALSGLLGLVTGGLDSILLQLVPVSTQLALRQLLPGQGWASAWLWHCQGRGHSLQASVVIPACYFQLCAVINNPAPNVCTSHLLPFGLLP